MRTPGLGLGVFFFFCSFGRDDTATMQFPDKAISGLLDGMGRSGNGRAEELLCYHALCIPVLGDKVGDAEVEKGL